MNRRTFFAALPVLACTPPAEPVESQMDELNVVGMDGTFVIKGKYGGEEVRAKMLRIKRMHVTLDPWTNGAA